MNSNLVTILNEIGAEIVEKYKQELINQDKVVTGKLYNSIDYKLEISRDSIKLIFVAEDYYINIENGRQAGSKMPPISKIREWCQFKGILDKNAYIIARSISLKGIRAIPSLEEIRNINNYTELIRKKKKKDYVEI